MTAPDTQWIMVRDIMVAFEKKTGLSPAELTPERYLWTDAFAVCNFLGLYRKTGDEQYRRSALLLVNQVHAVLGRHRKDDERTGWISGLSEEEGQRHPTKGGLRIGKKMRERRPDEPFDEDLEWERDGQYFHYLTQWMHALDCASRVTGDPAFNRWALELGRTVHSRFTYAPRKGGEKRLYWKMSIDLSYPLVPSMGHHDPLDGLIAYTEVQSTSGRLSGGIPHQGLEEETADMAAICEGKDWATDDPLGIGGLLIGAFRMGQLIVTGSLIPTALFEKVLDDSLRSLEYFENSRLLRQPAHYRLAFREFGLSTGLQAVHKLQGLIDRYPDSFGMLQARGMRDFTHHIPMSESINEFWLEGKNRQSASWEDHLSINMVMLATSLSPEGYLLPR